MSETHIPTTSGLAGRWLSVALFAEVTRAASIANMLTGPAPQASEAGRKLQNQTNPGYPCVRVTNLQKNWGDKVTVDCINIVGGKPIVGDLNAEGKGRPLSFSSQEFTINLLTQVIDVGGKMTQQRTKHGLKMLAKNTAVGYMKRLETCQTLVHLAGARGEQEGDSWPVPLSTDVDFPDIMINPVKAPTYNRHFVCDNITTTDLVKGGQQIPNLTSSCFLKLEHIDWMRTYLDNLEFRMQPVLIEDDPAAADEPIYVLLVPPNSWRHLLTNTSGAVLRTFHQNAFQRANWGSKHPLFKGEVGMWNNILVKKMEYQIYWAANGSSTTKFNTSTDTTGQESGTATMPTISGWQVDRCLLLGAQAIANVYGRNQSSDYHYGWLENKYNFERHTEIGVETMNGKGKIRFSPKDSTGTPIATDHGVTVIDVAAKTIG